MADGGHVAWDMERFQFLESKTNSTAFIPPCSASPVEQQLWTLRSYPSIYQVRGFDLSDISFVRGKTGWIVIDPLVSAETARAAWQLFQEHVGQGLPVSAVIYSHSHADHWGGVRGISGSGREVRAIPIIAPLDFLDFTISENVYAGQRHEPATVLPIRPPAACKSAWLCWPGPRPGRVVRCGGA